MFEFLQKIFKPNLAQVQSVTEAKGSSAAMGGSRVVVASIPIDPVAGAALKKRGNAFLAQGQLEAAAACYAQATEVNPQDVFAWVNLGFALCEQGRPLQAQAALHEALRLDPDQCDAHFMLGNVAQSLGDMALVTSHFREVLRLQPDFDFTAYFADETHYQQAVARYKLILSIDPENAPVHMSLGMTSLLLGDYATGWREYQWRFRAPSSEFHLHKVFPQPLWLGAESIQGKTILLHCEQGYGDTIQFCRYAPEVAARGAVVVLQVQRGLVGLLLGFPGVTHLVEEGEHLPSVDFHCPLMSLPLALGHSKQASIPAQLPYLQAEPDRMEHWRVRLEGLGLSVTPRIGVVWSGNPAHKRDLQRSIALEQFLIALPIKLNAVCLQPVVRQEDESVLQADSRISFPGEAIASFSDTAALISCLDVVVTVDTSVAHLAGAMGKTVWVLLPFVPDWRWLLDRADSPWYASARLFRQHAVDDWSGVLHEVRGELVRWAESGHD